MQGIMNATELLEVATSLKGNLNKMIAAEKESEGIENPKAAKEFTTIGIKTFFIYAI